MENTKKRYWKGLEELTKNPEFEKNADKEFPEYLPISGDEGTGASRRDFLKLMGFGVAAASLAACETPVKKAIPYLNKPVDVDPGVPNYYASTYVSGNDYCSVVVKTREGRPIKIDGNKLSKVSGGGTSAQAQSSVLSLYDKQRLTGPQLNGKDVTWDDLDQEVSAKLATAGKVTLVSSSLFSPSTQAAITKLQEKYPSVEHVQYDQVSFDGILNANEKSFGRRVVPSYDFSKADTIVSFGADFLGGWLNGSLHSKQFAQTRKLGPKKKTMSRMYAFESNMSLTGSNADYRTAIKPSQQGAYIANLYNAIATKAGGAKVTAPKIADSAVLNKAANDLWKSKGKSLVVSGSNDENIQILVNGINNLLGCYNTTISIRTAVNTRKGNDKSMVNFVKGLNAGQIDGVLFFNCNPVYDHAMGAQIAAGLKKAKFSVSTSDRNDETTALVTAIAPDHHFLEAWNDFEPVVGNYSFSQPTISPLFNTRQAQDSFLSWAGETTSYYDFLKARWSEGAGIEAQMIWDKLLQDGVIEKPVAMTLEILVFNGDVSAAASKISSTGSGVELAVYENYSVANGAQANNPWLQEMPDPITKAVWDNYVSISPKMAEELGLTPGDMTTQLVSLTVGNTTIKLPAMVQPGQAQGTVGVALGYGRTNAGKVADGVGVSAYPLLDYTKGFQSTTVTAGVKIELSGEEYKVAQTQTHETYMGRENVIQESILSKYKKDASAGRYQPMISTYSGKKKPSAISLWSGHEYPNHHWAMTIDLNSCTGCGACTVSCQAENNVPVVGKEEVLNRREMTWLRIDRYYSSDSKDDLRDMEIAAENPEVTFQPMMCQQCNNAPCETVCPVAATNHSTEGLNQMAYNRCIGTRYCANNCPYKVRRFNWFKYHDNDQFPENTSMNNDLGKMVLNPDVTVRARGVMEKCSFCVQKIQYGKLEAKKEGRRPIDGEITSACASACPSEAIVFGDLKNPESRISQMLKLDYSGKEPEVKEERAYHVLEELSVKPNVWYFTKIRNKDENEA